MKNKFIEILEIKIYPKAIGWGFVYLIAGGTFSGIFTVIAVYIFSVFVFPLPSVEDFFRMAFYLGFPITVVFGYLAGLYSGRLIFSHKLENSIVLIILSIAAGILVNTVFDTSFDPGVPSLLVNLETLFIYAALLLGIYQPKLG